MIALKGGNEVCAMTGFQLFELRTTFLYHILNLVCELRPMSVLSKED